MNQIEEFRRLKEEAHLTNDQIAEEARLPLPTVQKVISGSTKNPRLKTMVAIAKALRELTRDSSKEAGCSGDYLIREPENAGMLAEDPMPFGASIVGNLARSAHLPEIREEWDPSIYPTHRYTIDDYNALPEDIRVELIDGEFYLMSAPRTIHQRLLAEIYFQLSAHVRTHKGSCEVLFAPFDVQLDLDDKTMVQPDIVVICDPEKVDERGLNGAPDLAVEVVSPSSRKKDMLLKTAKYMNAGVREYWIIDPDLDRVMIYRKGDQFFPFISRLDQPIPVGIWDGACQIDLSGIKRNNSQS